VHVGILPFLKSAGGLKAADGELRASGVNNKFMKGVGALYNKKTGKSLDYAREAAAEAGYFDHLYGSPEAAMEKSTVNDLLDLIDSETRGNVVSSTAYDDGRAGTRADFVAQEEAQRQYRGMLDEINSAIDVLGIKHKLDDDVLRRAAEHARESGGDPVVSLDYVINQDYRALADKMAAKGQGFESEPEYIPFFSEPSASGNVGAQGFDGGPTGRGGNAQDSSQLSRAGTSEVQAPDGLEAAQASVGKPEDYKALAEQYKVDPETGMFLEESDLARLADEGRMTEDDIQAMADAQSMFENSKNFGEALKSLAGCVI
jgi:hypothetical protein